MQNNAIAQKAIEEVLQQNFGVTQQFLQVHELAYKDGLPEIVTILNNNDDSFKVYFAVKGEKFYWVVHVNTKPEVAVGGAGVESYTAVYLYATSETLGFQQLAELSSLPPERGWSKGDVRKSGKTVHSFSKIVFETNNAPEILEKKLDNLLYVLEKDIKGIINLTKKAYAAIQVVIVYHNGNGMLGGPYLNKRTIKRLASLNLEIDFDTYVSGNSFEE